MMKVELIGGPFDGQTAEVAADQTRLLRPASVVNGGFVDMRSAEYHRQEDGSDVFEFVGFAR